MLTLEKILLWVLLSSKDPARVSTTVRGALLFAVPYITHAVLFACTIGIACVVVDADELTQAIEVIAMIVNWGFSIIGGVMFLWGFARKVWSTWNGTNGVLRWLN